MQRLYYWLVVMIKYQRKYVHVCERERESECVIRRYVCVCAILVFSVKKKRECERENDRNNFEY